MPQNTRRRTLRLILDFDGTITKNDTTAIIGSRCLAQARKLASYDLSEDKLPKPMDYYGERYMQDYEQWKQSRSGCLETGQSVQEVITFLSASRQVEQASYQRVRHAVLAVPGSGMHDLASNEKARDDFMLDAGRQAVRSGEVEIRDLVSLKRLISRAEGKGNTWGIVSVSWSRRFILGALLEAGLIDEKRREDMVRRIKCNELLAPNSYDNEGRLATICTAQDKLDAMKELLSEWDHGDGRDEHSSGTMVVYVGDSSTDVGCLTSAAVGFYLNRDGMGESAVMRKVVELGMRSTPIRELIDSNQSTESALEHGHADLETRTLCAVRGFEEIDEWVSEAFQDGDR